MRARSSGKLNPEDSPGSRKTARSTLPVEAARTAAISGLSFLEGEFLRAQGDMPGEGIDLAAEKVIVESLERSVGNAMILSEESGWIQVGRGGAPLFVVDPLDGTNNFLHGLPLFGVAIGLSSDGGKGARLDDLDYGVVASYKNEVIEAERGKGLRFNNKAWAPGNSTGAVAGQPRSLKTTLARIDKRSSSSIGDQLGSTRLWGAAAIELSWLALGRLDLFIDSGTLKLTDIAGPYVILREAQAIVTDIQGASFGDYVVERTTGIGLIVATVTQLHDHLVKLLREKGL